MTELYDPLTYNNLMEGLVSQFKRRQHKALADTDGVEGPGIYALFYSGAFAPYRPISATDTPIYVGKAVPRGARKGVQVDERDRALRRRLREHAKSIGAANNLRLADFTYRQMAVVPVWITLAERFLVDYYKPVWNLALDGFGDHDPGSGRRNSQRSRWDTLHPGRRWADGLAEGKTLAGAEDTVASFFRETAPVPKPSAATQEASVPRQK